MCANARVCDCYSTYFGASAA